MAVRKVAGKKSAKKEAPKPAAKKKAAAVKDDEGRLVATALMDQKSADFRALTERRQAWVKRHQDSGAAFAMKNVHRILDHNKGLYIISTTTGEFQVGSMSASGKSFNVDFSTEDVSEAWDYYRENRSGNYGGEKSPTPKGKKAAPKKAAPKKVAKGKGRKTSKKNDDLDDLLD